jgi:hypothetical protein
VPGRAPAGGNASQEEDEQYQRLLSLRKIRRKEQQEHLPLVAANETRGCIDIEVEAWL